MLQTTPRASEYLLASGQIDRGHVFREAHRRVKAELAKWRPSIFASEPPKYAELFREKLTDEMDRARCAYRRHFAPLTHNPLTAVERNYFGVRWTEYSFN